MTSSLRNSLHRRNHKERSQLAHRTKLGILEKHADYVKRARDYHSKRDRLTRLKQKAAERNKDEFYFSMKKERTQGGVHIQSRGNTALPTDIVKVLKTQDENYVRTMRASGLKKIDKIKGQLTEMSDLLLDDSKDALLEEDELKTLRDAKLFQGSAGLSRKRTHILFAESPEEATLLSSKGKEKDTVTNAQPADAIMRAEDDDLGWKIPSSGKRSKKKRKSMEPTTEITETDSQLDKRKRLLQELSARLDRDKKLRYTQREFEMQRLMMGKGARRKIAGIEKVDGDEHSEDDEDTLDARKGKARKNDRRGSDEETYRPRVYKWRLERKR